MDIRATTNRNAICPANPERHLCDISKRFLHREWHTVALNRYMMTSWNGNLFHVTGHLCGEFTGDRWIPRTKASDARSFDVFFDLRLNRRLSKQWWGWWFETLLRQLWRHRNHNTHQYGLLFLMLRGGLTLWSHGIETLSTLLVWGKYNGHCVDFPTKGQ